MDVQLVLVLAVEEHSLNFYRPMRNALIIFAKNATLGNVKTRLAVDLGDELTLKFYQDLMKMTRNECLKVEADIHLFYSDEVIQNDIWTEKKINKHLQLASKDLGERMIDAFQKIFTLNYNNVAIIGTDCPYLTSEIINESFTQLIDNEIVAGPSMDGGFYLLGVKSTNNLNFSNITWSTNTVLSIYLKNCAQLKTHPILLKKLEDIDDIASYNRYKKFINSMNKNNL